MRRKLAIQGDGIQIAPITKIFEDLGVMNFLEYSDIDKNQVYTYVDDKLIVVDNSNKYCIFNWIDFRRKYPYSLHDRIQVNWSNTPAKIIRIRWDEEYERIVYDIQFETGEYSHGLLVAELNNTISESKEKVVHSLTLLEGYEFVDDRGNVLYTNQITMRKIITPFPTTYEECCEIMGVYPKINDLHGYQGQEFTKLQRLIVCRDAYWKLMGERKGLDKSWEPDWEDGTYLKYSIDSRMNQIRMISGWFEQKLLSFPDEDIRDEFYNNFKVLIEQCKKWL